MVVFFSIAGFFHQYYLITLAPAIAALTGAGLVKMWKDLRGKGIWRYALPVVMLVDLGFEWGIVKNYPTVRTGLLIGSIGAAALAALFIWRGQRKHFKRIGVIFGVLSLLVAPGYWALTPILDGVNASMPAAGPQSSSFGGGMGNMTMSNQTTGTSDSALIAYLEKHYKASQGSYLVATQNADTAAPIIIATGLPVMAMGGFNGSDPAITVKKLEQLTKSGKLKYFLLQTGGGFGGGGQAGQSTATDASARTSAAQGNSSSASGKKSAVTGMPTMLGDGNAGEAFSAFGGAGGMGGSQSAITKWITAHCKVVSSSAWESTTATTSSSGHNMGGGGTLYEYVGS
jgi:4-amino-4-deoxy-L-arabinose transferase-like glycosyltransferase